MIFSKKILIISLIVIVVAVLAFFVFFRGNPDESEEASAQDAAEEARKVKETPLPVKVVEAQIGDLIIKLKFPGEAVTNMKINMKAEVAGVIKSLNVEESKHVKKGELLVELDDEKYRLDLEQEEATRLKVLSELLVEKRFAEPGETRSGPYREKIKKVKDDYEEARRRFRSGLISKAEFEKASTEYELSLIESGEKKEEIRAAAKGLTQAEIRVKAAQMILEKTKIKAPFSGIIHDIKVSPKEHVTSGRELFTLVNIDRIRVHAKVLESEIGKMKVGREVDLKFSAYPGKIFKGEVKAISPVINPQDKTCNVIIDVANPEKEIKPGMHVEVEIAAEIHKNKLLIPQDAVLVRSGRKLAFVVEEGLAKWRYIEVGLENEDYAEVLDGVKEGESVIIEGHFTLAHDARVRIQK
jgi:RND family efflux transporter MFP subunit